MKKSIYYILFSLLLITLSGCQLLIDDETVIDTGAKEKEEAQIPEDSDDEFDVNLDVALKELELVGGEEE